MTKTLRKLKTEIVAISYPKPYPHNAKEHKPKQIRKLANIIGRFGWTVPILIDKDGNIIAGHARLEAAKLLGLEKVYVIRIEDLSDEEVRALRLADNRIAEESEWIEENLRFELTALIEADIDFEITDSGFEMAEIDIIVGDADPPPDEAEPDDDDITGVPVAQSGDLWQLGDHWLLCGDARQPSSYQKLLGKLKAGTVLTDPPYGVPIKGHVSGKGKNQHGEFVMGSKNISNEKLVALFHETIGCLVEFSKDGSIHYIFMDWRHQRELMEAARDLYTELKNICVWTKTSGGMGSFYRSAHEFIFVFKSGKKPHINNIELGRYGRNRTNVWSYPGVNSFGKGRDEALKMHPTVKPVAMIADAILDASNRGDIILDPFAGSGTIFIAAERTGRKAYGIELDPKYVDVALRRYRRVTGKDPVHVGTGKTLTELEEALEASETSHSLDEGDES